MEKINKTILTGLQPTGEITLGNYVGAIKQVIENQDKYENSYLFIADMHAITIKQDPKVLKENIRKLLAIYLAAGVDATKNIIFLQSENEYHTNVSWLLECTTYFGELSRMIQFKEKSRKSANFSAGLFTYPVLMASDILIYDADIIPVGVDQKQHVELTRDIAIRFNKLYGNTFNIPDVLITKEGTKIMDLQNPTKKMSKSSDNPNSVIRILDDIDTVKKKILKAETDSEMKVYFDEENKPGISNLLNIYIALKGVSMKDAEETFKNSTYKEFKEAVAEVVSIELGRIQKRYYELINSEELDEILEKGRIHTQKIAKAKFEDMKKKMGLTR